MLQVREGVSACLTGIGVDAIAIGILAISTTRNYLEVIFGICNSLASLIHTTVQTDFDTLTVRNFHVFKSILDVCSGGHDGYQGMPRIYSCPERRRDLNCNSN